MVQGVASFMCRVIGLLSENGTSPEVSHCKDSEMIFQKQIMGRDKDNYKLGGPELLQIQHIK